jgi:hypothetical protein
MERDAATVALCSILQPHFLPIAALMKLNHSLAGLTSLLALTTGGPAYAQSQKPVAALSKPGQAVDSPILQLNSFTAAYDSLMHRAAQIRTHTESQSRGFKASRGSLAALHRRVRVYGPVDESAADSKLLKGNSFGGSRIKLQKIKHRFGVEFEKVVYYNAKNRPVLVERYENHQLTRLELTEFSAMPYTAKSSWLLVQGDYLRFTTAPLSLSYNSSRRTRCYFYPRVEKK